MSPELTANRTLTADDVRNEAVALLEGLVDESVGGYRVNRTMLLDAIVCRQMLPPRGFRAEAVEHFDEARLRLHRLKPLLRYAIEQRYARQPVVTGPAS